MGGSEGRTDRCSQCCWLLLSDRNLGRDDRIISDHGKEARFPYLDEGVISLLQCLPPHLVRTRLAHHRAVRLPDDALFSLHVIQKYRLEAPAGIGDKEILRYVAGSLLGLPKCATLVKRAIQFGSRISQNTNNTFFGSNAAGKKDKWRKGDRWNPERVLLGGQADKATGTAGTAGGGGPQEAVAAERQGHSDSGGPSESEVGP